MLRERRGEERSVARWQRYTHWLPPSSGRFLLLQQSWCSGCWQDCQAGSLSVIMCHDITISHVLTIIVKTVQPDIWVIMLTVWSVSVWWWGWWWCWEGEERDRARWDLARPADWLRVQVTQARLGLRERKYQNTLFCQITGLLVWSYINTFLWHPPPPSPVGLAAISSEIYSEILQKWGSVSQYLSAASAPGKLCIPSLVLEPWETWMYFENYTPGTRGMRRSEGTRALWHSPAAVTVTVWSPGQQHLTRPTTGENIPGLWWQ